ncbi:unnamed protein product [Sphagnum troendelagicum]|uniref:Uncharacterized protein n=1 Tax=Sphagnum troendelagicum TaxID=128251 RepID=A0ABP0THV5_9BRYO
MAPARTLSIQMMGTICSMIVAIILFDGAHLQTATAIRLRVPGSVDVNSSSSQLSSSRKAADVDSSIVVSATTIIDAVVEPAEPAADLIAMFTDSKQATKAATAGSYSHPNSWRLGAASPPPPASNVETMRKISESEESSATVLHRKPFRFHAQRADKGSPVPSGPGGNPGGN